MCAVFVIYVRTADLFGNYIPAEGYYKKVTVLTGKEITVEFSEPRSLQVDGETITGVKSYTARSAKVLAKG